MQNNTSVIPADAGIYTKKHPNRFRIKSGMTIKNRIGWELLLGQFSEANFLQSWAWGKFHKKLGNKVYRIAIPTASKSPTFHPVERVLKVGPYDISGMFLAVVENARRGRYLTVPGGPLLKDYSSLSLWKQALSLMKEAAKKENCSFIRIRPQSMDTPQHKSLMRQLGFRPAPMHLHAELTRILNLTKSDKELLKEMRKGTRYEIKKAQKMGIKVEQSHDENLIDDFIRLQAETARREHFVPFSRTYVLEQFRAFKKTGSALWFWVSSPTVISSDRSGIYTDNLNRFRLSAKSGGRNDKKRLDSRSRSGIDNPVSIAFVIFYRGEAVYHYAASGGEARKIPAAAAIQWAIIQEAKKRGCKTYNLWGDVADDQLGKHRFSGPSLFKRGFGGKQVTYLRAHDLPLNWKYRIDWGMESIRKKLRRL